MNTATALDAAALAAFEEILADAFAIMTGQEDMNALIEPALGLNVYRDLGTKFTRMKDLVHKLRETVEAEGPEKLRVCVTCFYVGLPGNEKLRLWVTQYLPDCAGQVSEEAFRAAQAAYAEARRAGQQRLAIAGFEALHEARDQAFVAQEIARFRSKLGDAARQLKRLNGYKQLHDILHNIQTGALARFSQLLLKPALDEFDLEELSLQHGQLSILAPRARVSIDQYLDPADMPAEQRWLPQLDAAIAPLANGSLDDPDTLRAVAIGIKALLRYELPRLNRALAEAARDIPFDDLSDLLRGAAERAPEDSPLRGRAADAAEALDRIAFGLAHMVEIHNGWQDVDTALWLMENSVRTAADRESRLELVNTWRNALGPVTTLEQLDAEGVATLRQSAEGFRTVLSDEAQGQTRLASAFYRYAGAVRLQFKRVDTGLLGQCVAIGKLETSLKALIEGEAEMDAGPMVDATDSRVQSLAELRERHLALLRAWRPAPVGENGTGEGATPDLARDAEALREAAAALGAWLDDPEERDRAQGMIDYWTAALGALPDRVYPHMLQLAPFDPALPAAAVARAEELLAEYQGTAREADADAILLRLVRPGPGDTIVCQPPLDRAFLEHADGVTDMSATQDDLIDALVAAGVIRKIPGESAERDKFDFMHGSIARACPRLRNLLDARRNVNATRDKLRATALLWKDSGHDRGYLLTGAVLDDAVQYQRDDKLLEEFIRASRDAEERGKRFRLILWTALTTALVVLVGLIGLAYYAGNNLGFTEGKSSGMVAGAEIGATIESEAPDAIDDIAAENLDRIEPETPPLRPAGAPGINGWIWVGDDEIRLLRWPESRQPVDPAAIRRGLAYRTRTPVRLRGNPPSENSAAGADRGLMPSGALVFATGAPVTVARAAGPQYWLPVSLAPRLRVQFTRQADKPLADRFAALLRQRGLDVDPPGENPGEGGTNLLNYFRKDDAGVASDTARFVARALQRPDGSPPAFRCELVANPSYGTGLLYLTLDFSGLALRDPRRGRGGGVAAQAPECR